MACGSVRCGEQQRMLGVSLTAASLWHLGVHSDWTALPYISCSPLTSDRWDTVPRFHLIEGHLAGWQHGRGFSALRCASGLRTDWHQGEMCFFFFFYILLVSSNHIQCHGQDHRVSPRNQITIRHRQQQKQPRCHTHNQQTTV